MSTDETPEPLAPANDPPPLPPDRRSADLWLIVAIVLVPSVVGAVVSVAWPLKAGGRPTVPGAALNMVAMLAGWAGLIAFLIASGPRPAAYFGLVRPKWSDAAIWGVLFLGLWQLAATISHFWRSAFGDGSDLIGHEHFPHPPEAWWEYAITAIELMAVGVVEELVWRGYLFTRWEEVAGSTRSALIGTSLLFGLAHLYQGPHGVLSTAADAFLLCGVFAVLRRLWPVAIAHGLLDIILTITA